MGFQNGDEIYWNNALLSPSRERKRQQIVKFNCNLKSTYVESLVFAGKSSEIDMKPIDRHETHHEVENNFQLLTECKDP